MPNANLGPGVNLAVRLANIEKRLDNLMTAPWLLNASTGQDVGLPGITIDTDGVHAFDANGQNVTAMLTADGSVTAYDSTGAPVARFGPLTNSNPGSYGVEVATSTGWQQVGTQVPNATNADGSAYAYMNNVPGTSYYAVWVGNDGSNHFGKNTSSIRYKTKVRVHRANPDDVLQLQPVLYERIQNPGITEYGLIAEQVAEHVPELVQWFEGRIDNVRYDLLAVALLDVVKGHQARIQALEQMVATANGRGATSGVEAGDYVPPVLPTEWDKDVSCNNAPPLLPAPLPYTIAPQNTDQASLTGSGSLAALTPYDLANAPVMAGGGSLTF